MNIGHIITKEDYAVSPTDNIKSVLDKMAEFHVAQLPVVKDDIFLGLLADEVLVEHLGEKHSLQQVGLTYQQVYVYDTQHLYDAVLFFRIHAVDVMPVLDDQHSYLGSVTPLDLINALSQTMSLHQPGGIIVLEMGQRDNALSHIAHIVESDNAQVLNSYVQQVSDSSLLEVTIKVNKSDISSIVASFLRHDYHIKATYNDENSRDNSHDRYEQLMNYINM